MLASFVQLEASLLTLQYIFSTEDFDFVPYHLTLNAEAIS